MKGCMHMLLALLAISAAGSAVGQSTIASVASSVPDLSTLVTAVGECPSILAAATDPSTAVTVFAPTNEAFATALESLNMTAEQLLNDTTMLCDILSYHIVPAVINSSAAMATPVYLPTLLTGSNVTVQLINGSVYVNDAMVTTADVMAGMSIVHIINKVLMPMEPPMMMESPIFMPAGSPMMMESPMMNNSDGNSTGMMSPSMMNSPSMSTIASVAMQIPDLSTFLAAVEACPPILAAATNASTAVTVFAPTNEAFAALLMANNMTAEELLNDTSSLCAVLELHVVPMVVRSTMITDMPMSVMTLLPSVNVTVQMINGSVYVNNAMVTIADVFAGESVIHVINQVISATYMPMPMESPMMSPTASPSPMMMESPSPMMMESPSPMMMESPSPMMMESPSPMMMESPSPMMMESPMMSPMESPMMSPMESPMMTTIASVAATVPELSTLLAAVQMCPTLLAAATTPTTNITVFAPTNMAFEMYLNMTNMTAAQLLASPKLCGILEYHIVMGQYTSHVATLAPVSLQTLNMNMSNITIQLLNGTVYVNNAKIIVADVYAGDSIVQVIDAVLMETPTIISVAASIPQLSTFVQLVGNYSDLLMAAANPETMVTVFAPSNGAIAEAIKRLAYELSITEDEVLADTAFIHSLLSYHISPMVINTSMIMEEKMKVATLLPKAHLSLKEHRGIYLVDQYTRISIQDVMAGNSMIQVVNKMLLPTNYDSYYTGGRTMGSMMRRSLRGLRKML